jgi:hypothetical protein
LRACCSVQSASSNAREDPDDAPALHPPHDVAHATLELADVRLAGIDLGGARLEEKPALFVKPPEHVSQHRRLPHPVLPDEKDRVRTRPLQC